MLYRECLIVAPILRSNYIFRRPPKANHVLSPTLYKFTIGTPYSFFIYLRVSSPKYFIIELSCRNFRMKNGKLKWKKEKKNGKLKMKNFQRKMKNGNW
jgi:hypothetical protein